MPSRFRPTQKIKISKSSDGHLSDRYRITIYLLSAILWGSGVAWAAAHYFLVQAGEFSTGPHFLERPLLQIHGAAAPVWLILFGSLIPLHLLPTLPLKKSRRSGFLLLALILILILTGYLLYYCSGESARFWISQIHLWIGVLFFPVLVLHAWLGQRD